MDIELIKMTQHGRFHFYPNFPNDKLPSVTVLLCTPNVFQMWTWKRIILSNDLHSTQKDRFEKWSRFCWCLCRRRKSPHKPTNQNNVINWPKNVYIPYTNTYLLMLYACIFICLSVAFDQIWRFIQMKNDWLNLSFHFLWLLPFFPDVYDFRSIQISDLLLILVSFGCPICRMQ